MKARTKEERARIRALQVASQTGLGDKRPSRRVGAEPTATAPAKAPKKASKKAPAKASPRRARKAKTK